MTDDERTRVPASPTGTPLQPRTIADRTQSPLFQLGQVVATPGALQLLKQFGVQPFALLARHQSGDWGNLDASDMRENSMALVHGHRIFSSYQLTRRGKAEPDGASSVTEKVWIITEADRSSTTVLLPSEY